MMLRSTETKAVGISAWTAMHSLAVDITVVLLMEPESKNASSAAFCISSNRLTFTKDRGTPNPYCTH